MLSVYRVFLGKVYSKIWLRSRFSKRSYISIGELSCNRPRLSSKSIQKSWLSTSPAYNSLNKDTQKLQTTHAEQHGMIADFERALFKRLEQAGYRRSKRFYWVVWTLTAITTFGGGYLYFFPNKLRQQVVEEVSTVASQSLEDEKIVMKAGQLSRDILSGILNDSETKIIASDFIKDVIVSDPIKEAAIGTILGLLNDPKVLSLLRLRLTEIILNILQNESTRQIVISQVNSILQHESIQMSLQKLLEDLVDTPEVKSMMADFFKDVLSSDTVKDQGKILGQQVTTDVITSKEIQEQAGNALWSAVKFSVIPNMFKGKSSIVSEIETETKDKLEEEDVAIVENDTAKNKSETTPLTESNTDNIQDSHSIYYTEGKQFDKYSVEDLNDS